MNKIPSIDINSIDLSNPNLTLHLTQKEFENSINKKGLAAQIGKNSTGILGGEKTSKVFFTKSIEGTLMYLNRWLNIINESLKQGTIYEFENKGYNYFIDIYKKYSKNNSIPENTEKISFEIMEELLKRDIFYKCNLTQSNIEEYNKMNNSEKSKIDYLIDDVNEHHIGVQQTINNMHTISGKGISRKKLQKLTINGQDSALEISKSIIKEYMQINPNKKLPVAVHPNGHHDDNMLNSFYDELLNKEKNIQNNNFIDNLKELVNHDISKYKDISENNEIEKNKSFHNIHNYKQ